MSVEFADKYAFDEDFQAKIIAMMFRHRGFLRDFREVLSPSYFDKEPFIHLARIILHYWDAYKTEPNDTVIREEVRRLGINIRMADEMIETMYQWADHVGTLVISDDAGYIIDSVVQFGRRQAIRQAISLAIDDMRAHQNGKLDIDKIKHRIDRAMDLGSGIGDIGIDFKVGLETLPQRLANQGAYTAKIKTPWDTLNRATHGGFGRGEIGVIMARPGIGKTWGCINCGAFASQTQPNCDVVHYTIGDLQQVDVEMRYAQRLFGVTQDQIIAKAPEYLRRASSRLGQYGNRIWVKYFPPGVTKISAVVSHFEKLIAQEKLKVGLLIVDYPDQLKGAVKEGMYAAVGEIYDQLITLAYNHDCAVLAPSQVKREWDGDLITKENIANSDLKSAKSDVMVSFNQTAEERLRGTMRVLIDKCRRGKTGEIFNVNTGLEVGMLREESRARAKEEQRAPEPGEGS